MAPMRLARLRVALWIGPLLLLLAVAFQTVREERAHVRHLEAEIARREWMIEAHEQFEGTVMGSMAIMKALGVEEGRRTHIEEAYRFLRYVLDVGQNADFHDPPA